MRRALSIAVFAVLGAAASCTSSADEKIPATAPPSRHAAMRDALTTDARGLSFVDGDWLEDLGDAPFFGLAWLSRRAADGPLPPDDAARLDASLARARVLLASDLLSGDLQEKVMAALGVIEHVAAAHEAGDGADVLAVDAFLDRLDHLVMGLATTSRAWRTRAGRCARMDRRR